MANNGMYEISGFDNGTGCTSSFYRGTKKEANKLKNDLNSRFPKSDYKVSDTDFVGIYPRDDKRYNE